MDPPILRIFCGFSCQLDELKRHVEWQAAASTQGIGKARLHPTHNIFRMSSALDPHVYIYIYIYILSLKKNPHSVFFTFFISGFFLPFILPFFLPFISPFFLPFSHLRTLYDAFGTLLGAPGTLLGTSETPAGALRTMISP